MMETNLIVNIMSVIFLIPTQEFGGAVNMTISLKLVNLPKGVYIKESNKKSRNKSDIRLNIFIICCIYQNNPSDKI